MSRRPVLALLSAASVTIAACSSEEASPATIDSGATLPPITAAPTPTTTTTTVAPTTTPPPATTVAPTTTAPPATTVAPPTGPVDATIPLLVGGGAGGWLLLGTWASTRWEEAFGPDDPLDAGVPAGETVAISGIQTGATTGVTGAAVESCFDERTGPTIDAAVEPPDPPGFGYGAVALPATWPLQPRPVAVVDASVPAYQAAGEAVFADDPVDPSLATVEQIVLADLDGDGDEEALVAFEHVDPDGIVGTPGDLAAILLIDTATGTSTPVVETFVGPDDGDDTTFQIIDRFRVLAVADLNGDGRMEVVVHTWYHEGAGALAYEYDGTGLVDVLATGCGA